MKTVLFITYFYPPLPGSNRALRFSQLLPEHGWQPIVISGIENDTPEFGQDSDLKIPQGMEVHRVMFNNPPLEWRFAKNKLKVNWGLDYFGKWYKPVMEKASEIIKSHKIDLIYASCSPNISSVIALDLQKKYSIPCVVEWRDMWADSEFFKPYWKRTMWLPLRIAHENRIKAVENRCVQEAKAVIAVSWSHARYFDLLREDGVIPDKRDKALSNIYVVNNGYDENDYDDVQPKRLYSEKTLTLMCTGSIYDGYLPVLNKVLNAMKGLNIQLVYLGRGAGQLANLSHPNLTAIQYMPKDKALPFIAGTDCGFIILLPESHWVMPTEIYEFMRLGKPVVAVVPENADSIKTLGYAGLDYRLPFDEDGMRAKLKDLVETWNERQWFVNYNYIQKFERNELVRKLAHVFDRAVA